MPPAPASAGPLVPDDPFRRRRWSSARAWFSTWTFRGLAGVPALVDLVDVDSEKWFQYAAESRGVQRWLYRIEGRRLRRLEQSLPPRAKAITLVSDCEAELYRSFCPADSVHAIPNGVDLDYFRPGRDSDVASSQDCVFVGALDYWANIDGVHWFCDEVWPEVRRRRPEATFTLVGSRPSSPVRRLAQRPGIRLAGDVPDVRPYLAEAALVVVPLRIARGIQNKVLEALAMAKAVIATPEALEGIAVEPEVHVCQAGTPAQWIETITALAGRRADPEPSRPRRPSIRRDTSLLGPPIAAAGRIAGAAGRFAHDEHDRRTNHFVLRQRVRRPADQQAPRDAPSGRAERGSVGELPRLAQSLRPARRTWPTWAASWRRCSRA